MRRSVFDILVQINNMFIDYPDLPFSIKSVADKNETTWRTAKNCVSTLFELGLIGIIRLAGNKRIHYINRREDE